MKYNEDDNKSEFGGGYMKCPYCNEEMVKGYIQCRDGVDWTEKKQVIAALSALGKGRTSLANGAAEDNSAVYAYKCEKCKKVLMLRLIFPGGLKLRIASAPKNCS